MLISYTGVSEAGCSGVAQGHQHPHVRFMLRLPWSSHTHSTPPHTHQSATVDKRKCWFSPTGLFNLWWAWESRTPTGPSEPLGQVALRLHSPLTSCRCTCQVSTSNKVHFLVFTSTKTSRICQVGIDLLSLEEYKMSLFLCCFWWSEFLTSYYHLVFV